MYLDARKTLFIQAFYISVLNIRMCVVYAYWHILAAREILDIVYNNKERNLSVYRQCSEETTVRRATKVDWKIPLCL